MGLSAGGTSGVREKDSLGLSVAIAKESYKSHRSSWPSPEQKKMDSKLSQPKTKSILKK